MDHCGPLASCATCGPLCTWVDGLVCGDAQLDPGEECDDGNLVSGDGCQADCTICTNPASADDICDGNDDDCDGRFDEDVIGRVTSCGEGACFAYSTQSCQGGAFVPAECVPHAPGLEGACDGIDDDCDGAVDEDTSLCQQCSGILASAEDHAEAGRAYRVATCAPIFADRFDGDLSAWTVTGTVDIVSGSTTDLSGPGARLRGASELRVGVDTSHYDSAQLRYWRRGSSLEGNDTYEARYSADGGVTWTTLESTAGSVRVGPRAYALPESDSLLISFQTSFDSTSSDRLYLDDIVVTSGADLGVREEFEGSLRLYLADGTVSLEEGQGDRFARLAGGTSSQSNPRGELEIEVDTAAFAAPVLTYRSQGAGPSDPDTPDVDYSTDGGQSWTSMQPTLVVNDTTDRYAIDLPADPRLRLRLTGPDGDIQDAVYLRGLSVHDAGTTADAIFSDEFETDLSQWEVIAENLAVEIEDGGSGSGSLRIDGDAELRALIDTAPYGATLDIESSLEGTAGLTFRYTTDGVTWTTVHTGPRSIHESALELPASSQLLLSLLAENASGAGNEAHVERLRVRARPRPEPIADLVELQAATSDLNVLIPSTTGSASITESSSAGHLGLGSGIRMTGPGELTLAIDTSGHDSAELQFWTHSESMESSDIFRVSYSLDGGATYESGNLYLHHGTSAWEYRTAALPISADLVIKFDAQLSSTSDHALLDEVRVIARPTLPTSGCEEWLLEGTSAALGQDPTLVSTVFEATAASGNWLATTTGDLTCDGLDEDCDGTVDEQCEGLVAASDGTLLIELEGYDAIESGEDQHWAIVANTEASQGLAVHLEDGGTATAGDEPWLHYEVRFTQPGRYYAWLRADVTQAAGSWTYPHIHLQGQHITTMRLDPAAPDYSWQRDVDAGEPEYIDVVLAGNYTLSFKSSGNAYREYDQLLLTLNPDFVPQGTPVCGDPAYAEVQCVTECSVAEQEACVAACGDAASCADMWQQCRDQDYCEWSSAQPCVPVADCEVLEDVFGDLRSLAVPQCSECLTCYAEISEQACGSEACVDGACGPGTTCETDYDCAPGLECREDFGDRFGLAPDADVCWDSRGCDDVTSPTYDCGTVDSWCGECVCPPGTPIDCSGLSCGSDGCTGSCGDVCAEGEAGCRRDSDCEAGSVCSLEDVGDDTLRGTCVPDECLSTGLDNPCIAGQQSSICDIVCDRVVLQDCGTRTCGLSPSGEDCGTPPPGFLCIAGQEFPDGTFVPTAMASRAEPQVTTAEVGAVPGSFSITPGGGVSYQVPLRLPPGRGGMTPSLALSYDSGRGNGHMGVGWALEGIEAITRCPQTVAQDGAPGPLSYEWDGPYCLNGRRLVEAGVDADGNREYRFELDDQTVIKSETVVDTSSVPEGYELIYAAYSQPTTFTVIQPDGHIRTFGGTEESRISAGYALTPAEFCQDCGPNGDHLDCPCPTAPLEVPVTQTWALSRITDRAGNYAAFAYDEIRIEQASGAIANPAFVGDLAAIDPGQYADFLELNASREYYPTTITYSLNDGSASSSTDDDHTAQGLVVFSYEDRPDTVSAWRAGINRRITRRLDGISVYSLGASRRYNLEYDTAAAGGQSRLTSLNECVSDQSADADPGTCLPSTHFDYEPAGGLAAPYSFNEAQYAERDPDTMSIAMVLDFDGDGRDDIYVHWDHDNDNHTNRVPALLWAQPESEGGGFQTVQLADGPAESEQGEKGDFNNDGRDDIFVPIGGNLYLSSGSPPATFERVEPPAGGGGGFGPVAGSYSRAVRYRIDLSADGRADTLGCYETATGTVWSYSVSDEFAYGGGPITHLSTSEDAPLGCPRAAPWGPAPWLNYTETPYPEGAAGRALDLDGDGAQELVFPDTSSMPEFDAWGVRTDLPLRTAPLVALRVNLPAESGASPTIEFSRTDVPWHSKAADLNGDGLVDFYSIDYCADSDYQPLCQSTTPAVLRSFINRGTIYPVARFRPGNPISLNQWVAAPSGAATFHLATAYDYDGDGKQDVVAPALMPSQDPGVEYEPRWVVFRSTGRSFELQELDEELRWDTYELDEPSEEVCTSAIAWCSIDEYMRFGRERLQVADFNGDGFPDLVKRQIDPVGVGAPSGQQLRRWVVLQRSGSTKSRMVAATDGTGLMETVTYRSLSDLPDPDGFQLYTDNIDTCPSHQSCLRPRGTVVYQSQAGFALGGYPGPIQPRAIKLHSYADFRVDVTGRGPLGFGTTTTETHPVDLPGHIEITEVTFDEPERDADTQLYVNSGIPRTVTTTQQNGDHAVITTVETELRTLPDRAPGTLRRYVYDIRTIRREVLFDGEDQNGDPIVLSDKVVSDRGNRVAAVDEYGNPTARWEGTPDPNNPAGFFLTDVPGGLTVTFFTYAHATEPARFDAPGFRTLVASEVEQFTLTGQASPRGSDIEHERRAEYDYYDNGLIERVETDGPEGAASPVPMRLTARYVRDDEQGDFFGNVIREEVSGVAGLDGTNAPLPEETRVTTFVYDDRVYPSGATLRGHFPSSIINAASHEMRVEHDPRFGEVARRVHMNGVLLGAIEDTRRDGFGRVVAEVAPDGTQTHTTYWKPTAADSTIDAMGLTDMPLAVETEEIRTNPPGGGPRRTVVLDWLGREVATVTPGGIGTAEQTLITRTAYDDLGRRVWASRPHVLGSASEQVVRYYYEHDATGRRTRTTWSEGDTETAETGEQNKCYDGLFECSRSPRGFTRCIERDPFGRVVRSYDPEAVWLEELAVPENLPSCGAVLEGLQDGSITMVATEYFYGEVLERVVDAADNETVITPDEFGRKVAVDDPDAGSQQYVYNAFGEQVRAVDGNGDTAEFTYDLLGRLVERLDHDLLGSGVPGVTSWTYDGTDLGDYTGLLKHSVGPDGHEKSFEYDLIGQVTASHQLMDGGVTPYTTTYSGYQYGLPTTVQYPSAGAQPGLTVHNDYDDRGRLERVTDASDPTVVYWELAEVDAFDRVRVERLGPEVETTYRYDDRDRIDQVIDERDGDTDPIRFLDIARDLNGNVTDRFESTTVSANQESYLYDRLDRLRGESIGANTSYTEYDAIGNIDSRDNRGAYEYAPLAPGLPAPPAVGCTSAAKAHAAVAVGSDTYCYDAAGRRLWRRDGTTGNDEFISYTRSNKPRQMWRGSPDVASGTDVVSIEYDADLGRVLKSTDDEVTVYVGGIFEHRQSSAGDKYIYYVSNGSRTIAQVQINAESGSSSQETLYLHADPLGSATMLSSPDLPWLLPAYSYDAWGRRRSPTDWSQPLSAPDTSDVHIGFTGHEYDREYELINMRGREYDPVTGRFLSPDPIVQFPHDSQSLNRFSYVLNNPLGWVDPSGFELRAPDSIWKYGSVDVRMPNFASMLGQWLSDVVALADIAKGPVDDSPDTSAADGDTAGVTGYEGDLDEDIAEIQEENERLRGQTVERPQGTSSDEAEETLFFGPNARHPDATAQRKTGGTRRTRGGGAGSLLDYRANQLWRLRDWIQNRRGTGDARAPSGGLRPAKKRGPKPFGTGAHNLKIREVAQGVRDGKVIAGGQIRGLPEAVVRTPGGVKSSRRPDILVQRPDGSLYGINVGLRDARGRPIRREREAINDLIIYGNLPTYFVPYN